MDFSNNLQIKCWKCKNLVKHPVNCLQCEVIFCLKCSKEINNKDKNNGKEGYCPYCKSSPFMFKLNDALNIIINNNTKYNNCRENIIKKKDKSHLKNDRLYKCLFCLEEFMGENKFKKHFLKDEFHKDYLIKIMNLREKASKIDLLNSCRTNIPLKKCVNRNQKMVQQILNNQQKRTPSLYNNSLSSYKSSANIFQLKINESEPSYIRQIEEEKKNENNIKFENIISRKIQLDQTLLSSKSSANIFNIQKKLNLEIINLLPSYCQYNEKSQLIYCGRNNNLNCKCCKDNICKPGNCFCCECMELNKKFHLITKPHYLINKKGRVARYQCKTYHCYFETKNICKNNNNTFEIKNICTEKNPCKACKELTLLIDKYLPKELIEKLKLYR